MQAVDPAEVRLVVSHQNQVCDQRLRGDYGVVIANRLPALTQSNADNAVAVSDCCVLREGNDEMQKGFLGHRFSSCE